ncbi:MAG: electron transport complex subunit RsxE [Bacilli bacterium]|jgi:electron transport complex protein RnfE
MKDLVKGIINENPVFVLMLGICPTLAVTTTVENAIVMGLSLMFVLIFSNFLVSLIKNFVPEQIKIPTYILIIATFVTMVELLLKAYVKDLYDTLGIYIPLIVVNCIILGRALGFASKEKVFSSILDGIGFGLGFTLSLIVLSAMREIFGNNTITIMDSLTKITGYQMIYKVLPNNNIFPINILLKPAGALLSLGLLTAFFNSIRLRKEDNQ